MMFQRLLTPESLKKFAGDTRDAIRSESAVFESEHLRKDGCIIPVETHVHGLELDGEKFILRVVRDVTERKQAERALKESEEKFRVIFENAPIGIYLTDTEDRILAVNDALCAVTGYARDEILNRNSAGFTHPDDLAFSSEWLRKIVAEEQAPRSIETRYLGSDGRVIHAEVSASLIRRAHGPLMHVVVALRDITGRKKAELAREKLMKDLTSTNSEIAQFNSLIAHDLQEPLRMVRSYSELLEKNCAGRLNASGEEFLGYVLSGGKLMQKMLEDLLRYSREGAKAGTPQEVDMNRIMDHVLLLLKSSIDDNKAVISCGRLPVVTADRAQMTHLMLNLVGNAVKFKGADVPRVSVSGVAAKDSYVFTVRDNGIGIAPQFFDRVFKMFQRLHSREEYPGTGMGLALCRKIVENHGGRIWVESLPGKGADFSFTIPRPDKDPVADEEKRN
jgi:PAS domain S-box-containing protein